MIFNEILIPQDFFTETNITRKRVRRRKFAFVSNQLILLFYKAILKELKLLLLLKQKTTID